VITLPISKGFYNWRNMQDDNVQFMKNMINKPMADVYNRVEEVYCYNVNIKR